MKKGSQPTDGGGLILTEAEKTDLLRDGPTLRLGYGPLSAEMN
ncbi:MAG: hypothetical protein ABI946_01825 [Chthoniobacterales bacterium]